MQELAEITDLLTLIFSYIEEIECFLTICNTCHEWRSLYLNHFNLHDAFESFRKMGVLRASLSNYVNMKSNSSYKYCEPRERFVKRLVNTLDHQSIIDHVEEKEVKKYGLVGFIKEYLGSWFSSSNNTSVVTPSYDNTILKKVIVIGNSGIGKTTLLKSARECIPIYCHYTTVEVDFHNTNVAVTSDVTYTLRLWDTPDCERSRYLPISFFRNTHLILLCFSITDQESFNSLEETWIPYYERYFILSDTEMILVGLKSDLQSERTVSYDTAKYLANKLQIPYFEASGREYTNVTPLFLYTACLLYCTDQLKSTIH
jgi:small GTP-binding protein